MSELRTNDYQRAIDAMDALRRAMWFAEYLERSFQQVRYEERQRCITLVGLHVRDREDEHSLKQAIQNG